MVFLAVQLISAETLTTGSLGTTDSYAGIISGTGGSLTKVGTGTITLSGVNTYTGATTVNGGTLKAGVITQAFGLNSAMTIASGATLDLGGFNETIGSLAGAGTVTDNGANAILTAGGDNTSTTFSGLIEDGSGTTALTKAGTGALTLSGDNTYSGGTIINTGTLQVSNGNALGTGPVVNNAALNIGTHQSFIRRRLYTKYRRSVRPYRRFFFQFWQHHIHGPSGGYICFKCC